MNLIDYIKSQLPSMPNVAIMKDLGASEELIEYVRKTPWNTNMGIVGEFSGIESKGTFLLMYLMYDGATNDYTPDGYDTDIPDFSQQQTTQLSLNSLKQYIQDGVVVRLLDDSNKTYLYNETKDDYVAFQQENGSAIIKYYADHIA